MGEMSMLLRVAAVYSLAWALLLTHPAWVPFAAGVPTPEMRSMAHGLAIANLAFAYLCNRAANDPAAERGIVYAAMLLFGLRGIVGTYEVLYVLDMPAIVPRLFDMVFSLALFVGMLNVLPGPNRGSRG
jgi:hypothetical protein